MMDESRRWGRLWVSLARFLVVLSMVVVLAGCGSYEPEDHKIWNRSSETVRVIWLQDDGERVLVSALEPGRFYPWIIGNSCPDVVFVARTTAGREIARRDGPFCPDDEWVIASSAPSPAP